MKPSRGFSLTELLVALSILALVAMMVVPRFLSVREQAQETVAQQIARELNTTYANWKASGGIETQLGMFSEPPTSSVLKILSAPSNTEQTIDENGFRLSDSALSKAIRVSLPTGTDLSVPADVVFSDDYFILYGGGNFTVGCKPPGGGLPGWESQHSQGTTCPPGTTLVDYGEVTITFTVPGPGIGNVYKMVSGAIYKVTYFAFDNGSGALDVGYTCYKMTL